MRIPSVEAIPLKIPFTLGHERSGWSADMFQTLEMVLVRVETDAGLVGWGDAFAYGCQRAVVAAIEDMIAPKVVGADARDIAGLNARPTSPPESSVVATDGAPRNRSADASGAAAKRKTRSKAVVMATTGSALVLVAAASTRLSAKAAGTLW